MISCFFFKDAAPPEIYTLSLHDALPISVKNPAPIRPVPYTAISSGPHVLAGPERSARRMPAAPATTSAPVTRKLDRKSTRLNSSHVEISYAVFCLKKKKE